MLVVLGGFQEPAFAEAGRGPTATADADAPRVNEKRPAAAVPEVKAATGGAPAKGSLKSRGPAASSRSSTTISSGQPSGPVLASNAAKTKVAANRAPVAAAAKAERARAVAATSNAKAAGTEDTAPAALAAAESSRLGTADSFALLAGSTITNTGVSTIDGDIGLHPGSAVTGFESCTGPANCVVLTGAQHLGDANAEQAKADVVTAYNSLVGLEATCTSVNVELGGTTLLPGVYCSPTFGITGTVTLDGNNLVAPEFIFLTGSGGTTLITAVGSNVLLINGADACDVYWQVGSSATIGASSSFSGNILASASISFGTGATLNGSALALTGAVTLDNNTITSSGCDAVVTPPTDVIDPPVVTPPTDVIVPPGITPPTDVIILPPVVTPPTDVIVPPGITPPTDVIILPPVVTPPTEVIVPPGITPPTDVMILPGVIQPVDRPGFSSQVGTPGLTTTGLTTTGLTTTGLTSRGLTAPGQPSTGLTTTGLTSTGMTSSGIQRGAQSGSGLPVTGVPVQQELLLAGMAMALGSLLVLLSKPARRRSRNLSTE